jgi:hypothetical protein
MIEEGGPLGLHLTGILQIQASYMISDSFQNLLCCIKSFQVNYNDTWIGIK